MTAQTPKSRSYVRLVGQIISGLVGGMLVLLGIVSVVGGMLQGPWGMGVIGVFYVLSGLVLIPPVVHQLRKLWGGLKSIFAAPILAGGLFIAGSILGPLTMIGQGAIDPAGAPRSSVEKSAVETKRAQSPPPKRDQGKSRAERRDEEKRTRVTAEINTMWSELKRITQQCDQAATAASGSLDMSRSNLVRAYSAAEAAKRTCASVGLDVMTIGAPRSLDREQRRPFDNALRNCGMAYVGKSVMFEEMLKVIDGDRRPSQVARVQQAASISQTETVQCVLTITALAEEQGVDVE